MRRAKPPGTGLVAEILENRHVHDLPKRPGRPNTLLEIEDGLFREQPFFGGGQVGVLPEAPRVHLFGVEKHSSGQQVMFHGIMIL